MANVSMPLQWVENRFWFQSGPDSPNIDGFLPDPSSAFSGVELATDMLRLDDLLNIRSLALLGPPGSGKSKFLRRHQPLLAPETSATACFLDLATIGSEDRLVRELRIALGRADTSGETGETCLLLDSFDEAQQRIPHLASILMAELDGFPEDRLWLRIGCRTSEWPTHLDAWMKERTEAKVAEFAPFRRDDAKQAVAALVDPEAFIQAIENRGLAPLAATPLSLELLLRSYERVGEIPGSRVEAYSTGLLAMCDERSPQRRVGRAVVAVPSEVLDAGESAAACMLFAGRERLWTGPVSDADVTDLSVDELVRFAPGEGDGRTPTIDTLEQLWRSALFQGAGAGGQRWAHTTFPEFLTARWCISRNLHRAQIKALLFAPDGKIFPRMRRLAAWLISMDSTSFAWICEEDPESIAGEIDVPDDHLRSTVVQALLEHVGTGNFIRDWGTAYTNLRHRGLGEQLRPFLSAGDDDVRLMAIQLAADGHATDVQDDLLAIAVDPLEAEYLRYRSIIALRDLDWRGHELATLLENPSVLGEDSRRELRGAILDASWPHDITTSQALGHINVPATPWFVGHYSLAIHRIAGGLTGRDVEAAAAWLELPLASDEWVSEIRNGALALCADNIDLDKARTSAVSAVLRNLRLYQPAFGSLALSGAWPDERRRALLLEVTREASEDELFALLSEGRRDGLLHVEDFPWLVAQLDPADEKLSSNLLILLTHMFNPNRFDHANCLASLPREHKLVAGPLANWCEVIVLGSPRAQELREEWNRLYKSPTNQELSADSQDDQVEEWITSNLNKFDAGELVAYAHALKLVTVPPGARHYRAPFQQDLTKHPRWDALTQTTRDRLIAGAPKYLMNARCQPDIWEDPQLLSRAGEAAYRALILLLRSGTELDQLSEEVWREWAPVIISWRPSINGASSEDQETLIYKARPYAQRVLVRALLAIIDNEAKHGRLPFVHKECDLLWDGELALALTTLVEKGPSDATKEIASILMEHDPDRARPMLTAWAQLEDGAESTAIWALEILLALDAATSWPTIKNALDRRPETARAAVLNLADREKTHMNLTDEQLGYFYAWMELNFPREEDPETHGAHTVTAREQAGRWRDRLMEILIERGTPESVQALKDFAGRKPEESWRRGVLARAVRSHRESTWQPISLDVLSQLSRDRVNRLARTSQELREIVLEALATIQERLIGETPESHLLWDSRVMRPKSEDEASDYLLHRLRDLLGQVVVNREVQVRRNSRSGIPERADLLIEAPTASGEPSLKVVIEIKGAWSNEIDTAIPNQLIGRYMRDFQPAEGIYLVLWPDVDSWSSTQGNEDRRRLMNLNREETEAVLEQQAERGSAEGSQVRVKHLDISYRRPAA